MVTYLDRMTRSRNAAAALMAVAQTLLIVTLPADAFADTQESRVTYVNCDRGETLARHLRRAVPGMTVVVRGTCAERVTITTDRIVLDGQGTAILDGRAAPPAESDAALIIDGARGVVIVGFTVQDSLNGGIIGRRGAAFLLQHVVVRGNGTGVGVFENSTAELADSSIVNNRSGLEVRNVSSAVLKGAIDISDNATGGVDINGTSNVEIRGAHVQVNRNGAFGIGAGSNSQLAFFGFGPGSSEGSTLTVDANRQGGMAFGDSILNVFEELTTVTVTNSPVGIIARGPGSSLVSPFGLGTFVIENNLVGLDFRLDGTAIFRGGLNVRNNGTGVRTADGAGVLWFISIPPNPSVITGNGTDVSLQFGARATFEGVTVGTITCDTTVLIRGAVCQ